MRTMTKLTAALFAIVSTVTSLAYADAWSGWQAVDDNSGDRIYVRTRHNKFKFDGGAVEWYWQFKNGYDNSVKFDYQISCREGGGTPTSNTQELRPGQESSTGGSWTICRDITIRVGRVRKS